MSEADIEKKIGLSLDELIAQQKAKQASKPKPKPKAAAAGGGKKKGGPARVQKVQTKSGGRVLVVPRPKHVPRPSDNLKATRGGGVQKGGAALKYGGGGGARQGANRNVKVTIGNKLSGRPTAHIPTSGVLSKPFLGGGSGGPRGGYGGPGYNGGGRAAMQVEGAPAGGSLSSRFDSLAGVPSSGRARPTGEPRRNAHGVILP